MCKVKLFLFKARDANTIAILRRGQVKTMWQMIVWDLDTDAFTEGQWMTRKKIYAQYAAISPDGKYFAYEYDGTSREGDRQLHHAVFSKLPNFTAEYFKESSWDNFAFTNHNDAVGDGFTCKNADTTLYMATWNELAGNYRHIAPKGYIADNAFRDPKGRLISVNEGVIYADGAILYDTTNHAFKYVAPTY